MRPYRGKRVDNDEWVEGDLIHTYNYDYEEYNNIGIKPIGRECYNVYPKSVGQYIGIKDNDDIHLYKGDIVSASDNLNGDVFTGEIIFQDGSYCIKDVDDMTHYRLMDYVLTLLGNKFENPELMEVEE